MFLPLVEFRRPTAELFAAAGHGQALSGTAAAESGLQIRGQRQHLEKNMCGNLRGG